MGIRIRDNFNYRGGKPNFDRDLIENADTFNDWFSYPDGHQVYDKSRNKWYQIRKTESGGYLIPLVENLNNTAGIPIYTLGYLNTLLSLPDLYISIPVPSDANAAVTTGVYDTSKNGLIINLLFENIRALLAEIAKLKNTFYYGICSLTEGNTTSNHIINDEDEEATEPLWALDPEDLSEITSLSINIDSANGLTPRTGWTYSSSNNYIHITSATTLDASEDSTIEELDSPKVIFYAVIDPEDNFKFQIDISENESINVEELIARQKCNIMFVYSKSPKKYYWICITNSENNIILQKYFDEDLTTTEEEPNYSEISLFSTIHLENLKLYRLDYYTKELNFNNTSDLPTLIQNDDFVFKPAHITVRSVSDYSVLQNVASRLLENELVICKGSLNAGLYAKLDNQLVYLSGSGSSSSINIPNIAFTTTTNTLEKGLTLQLNVETNSTGTLTYASSNSNVASVNSLGIVTALSAGTVQITASVAASSSQNFSTASCIITLTITDNSVTPDTPTEDDEDSWTFGSAFPITFGNGSDSFITFPITF